MKLSLEQFQRLALEQLDMLYRLAARLTHNSAQAEDLVQETYLRALRAYDGFDLQEYGIRPWLVRIMQNQSATQAGRESRQPHAIDEEQLATIPSDELGDGLPIHSASFEAMDQQLVAAMDALPREYQTVLLLWAVEEFSYKEIAAALNVPIGTVMSRLYRARQQLAEQLKDYAVQEGIIREFPGPAGGLNP